MRITKLKLRWVSEPKNRAPADFAWEDPFALDMAHTAVSFANTDCESPANEPTSDAVKA